MSLGYVMIVHPNSQTMFYRDITLQMADRLLNKIQTNQPITAADFEEPVTHDPVPPQPIVTPIPETKSTTIERGVPDHWYDNNANTDVPKAQTQPVAVHALNPNSPTIPVQRRHLRSLVSDEIENVIELHPEFTREEVMVNVRDRLQERYGDSTFWDVILKILKIIGPILIELLLSKR